MGPTGLRQVLWINQHQRGDYMRDQLMVGMRHLVGANMVDWVKVLPPSSRAIWMDMAHMCVAHVRAYICI